MCSSEPSNDVYEHLKWVGTPHTTIVGQKKIYTGRNDYKTGL